jgi:hypothetical protein
MINHTIGFKVSFEEKKRLKALALQRNLRLSDYIRHELLENKQDEQLNQAIALILLYNGGLFEEAALPEINIIIDIFEAALHRLNSKQSSLLAHLISILSEAKIEVKRKGEYLFNIGDLGHELWLNFLKPALQE